MEEPEVVQRRRSKVEMYVHLVWTVKFRAPLLTSKYERRIHHCISSKAEEQGCSVLAIGGTPDHVHVLLRLSSVVSLSDLVRIMKTAATSLYNEMRPEYSEPFHWQDGYGCFSLWRTQLDKVITYIQEQKERHRANRLWTDLEEFDEPVSVPPTTNLE